MCKFFKFGDPRCDCGRFSNLGDKNSIQMHNFGRQKFTRKRSVVPAVSQEEEVERHDFGPQTDTHMDTLLDNFGPQTDAHTHGYTHNVYTI